jgi:lysophospholipase L1-like esterase
MRPLTLLGRSFILCCAALAVLGAVSRNETRVFLIGDSTMADKPIISNPEVGWGQMLPIFFKQDVVIENHARNGRSTKSFIDQGLWQVVVEKLQPGDYVFIQFGHNDSKKTDSLRYAEPHTTYKQNLIRFVREAKAKGAIPVLLTPINRRKYDEKGAFVDQHGDYPGVVREVAHEENTALIDMHAKTLTLMQALGEDGSKKYFLAGVPKGVYKALPNGNGDNTHFTKFGAFEMAKLAVEGLKETSLPLASHLLDPADVHFKALNKVVGLDNYFNAETKVIGTKTVGWHYVWQDTANSGFSVLGSMIDRMGADCDTLCKAPTREDLQKFSVYIIVDPDTPAESPTPHYMDEASADAIAAWVNAGGVLAIFENDKGNAEFEHFNILAKKFGMHFNEDSYHKVEGTKFDMGKSDVFPSHPIFEGVKKIYTKEVSSITVVPPAMPLLTENGIVLMATARVGRGLVFAIGDPWLYNEYIDNRKLPSDFENYKAAHNLFSWLLDQSVVTRR